MQLFRSIAYLCVRRGLIIANIGSAEATEAEKELENIVAALMKNIDKDVDKESTGIIIYSPLFRKRLTVTGPGTKEITSRADENKRTSSKRSRDDDGDKETPQKKRVKCRFNPFQLRYCY